MDAFEFLQVFPQGTISAVLLVGYALISQRYSSPSQVTGVAAIHGGRNVVERSAFVEVVMTREDSGGLLGYSTRSKLEIKSLLPAGF